MDNLSSLFDKGQYQAVIDLTTGSSEPSDLLYRASAYLALNNPEEAIDILSSNRERLYAFRPVATIKGTMGARYALNDYTGALLDAQWFADQPYVSQEVEEVLRELPKQIKEMEEANKKAFLLPKQKAKKEEKKEQDEQSLLSIITRLGPTGSPDEELCGKIASLLPDEKDRQIAAVGLLLLIQSGYPNLVEYKKGSKIFRVVPKDLTIPMFDKDCLYVTEAISKDASDPGIARFANTYFMTYALAMMPEKAVGPGESRLLEAAMLKIAAEALKSSVDLEALKARYSLSEQEITDKANEVNQLLSMMGND